MSKPDKTADDAAAKAASDKAAADKAAADKAAADKAAADKAAADKTADDDTDDSKKKKEKTYTKAELDAEKQKAIAEAKKKFDEEKDLTELERLKKENDELKASTRMRDAKDEVVTALTTAGSNSPALAFEAIKGSLQFDDAGKLINSKDLIESLKTSYPEQFGTPKPAEQIDGGKGQEGGGIKLTREALEKMSITEVMQLDQKEVDAVLSGK